MILLQKKRKKKLRSTGLAFDIVIISILSYLTRHFRHNTPNPSSLPIPRSKSEKGIFLTGVPFLLLHGPPYTYVRTGYSLGACLHA
ncbi:hypothetical protein V8C40DRAFT_246374 [Trichoderma camerunense]